MTEVRGTSGCNDLLIALGRQWEDAYTNWLEADLGGVSNEEIRAQEERKAELGKIAWEIEDKAAEVPAFSIEGVLVKLRIAGTNYHLMERDGEDWHNTYAKLTWQAWDELERLAGEARS